MKKNLILLLILVSLKGFSQQPKESAYPSDPDSLGKMLCQHLDLNLPALDQVKKHAEKKRYADALLAWRDYKVVSFRKSYMGPFGWHANQLNRGTVLPYAEYMVGKISTEDFLATRCDKDFVLFGFNEPPGNGLPYKWLAQNSEGEYPNMYSTFYNIIPLTVRYYQSGEEIYLKKWFHLTADFACKQKLQIEKLDAKTRNLHMCSWSVTAVSSLFQGDRVSNIIRGLGVVCKSLPDGGKPALWDSIYVSLNAPVSKESINKIPAVELAQITLSLLLDHPEALKTRFLKSGAVPNQRRNGLAALLFMATQFPEFKVSEEILKSATEGLFDFLTGAFYKDGGMLEQSFNYNMNDVASFRELIIWLKESNPILCKELETKQYSFYHMTATLRTPLGDLPTLSSHVCPNPTPVWRDVAARKAWLNKNAVGLPGKNDSLVGLIAAQFSPDLASVTPNFTSINYPYSGYAVQRKNWQWDSPYLFFFDRRPARGHTNMGGNSIQVYAYGRPLLVTAGPPVYDTGQLSENFKQDFKAINQLLGEETSLKNNTVMVDGQSQNKGVVAQTVYTTPLERRWHSSINFDFLEGVYDLGYPDAGTVSHRRQVIFVKDPGFWIVTDIMTNLDSKNHVFSQIWNLPGYQDNSKILSYGFLQKEVNITKVGMNTSDPTGPNVWLFHVSPKPVLDSLFYGQKNPYRGWYAPGFGQLIPAPQLISTWSSAQNSVLVTIIWPTPDNLAPAFKKLKNISVAENPSAVGFTMTLLDGRKVEFEVAQDNGKLNNKLSSFDAQSLLTVYLKDGSARGVVTGLTGNTPSVYEYQWLKGEIQILAKDLHSIRVYN
jgi:Heparinase II/III-like protein